MTKAMLISAARSFMLRSAITAKADIIVFIDYDMSWDPKDLLTLIETEGDVVAGTYRFKKDEEDYMGQIETDEKGYPITRPDGCIKAKHLPAGFLKITPSLLHKFMVAYPELVYGTAKITPSVGIVSTWVWTSGCCLTLISTTTM
jgi:hypothetical protein